MGASLSHLSVADRRRRYRRRRVGVAIAAVVIVAGGATGVVAVARSGGGGGSRLAVGGRRPGRRSGSTGPGRPAPSSSVPAPARATTTTVASQPVGGVLAGGTVRRYLAGRSGNITAAVYDVDTGTTSLWRPGVAEDTASIVKADILADLLHSGQTGDVDTDDDGDDDAGITDEQQELATIMIEDSDNNAASDLWDDDGAAAGIAAFDELIPMHDTTPGANGYWGLTTTTAADQVALIRKVALPNALLDTTSRHYELNLMEHVEPYDYWGVSGGVPSGVTVALKNGWLPLDEGASDGDEDWQVNSIGWIDGRGRDYVIAVLTNGNGTEGYGIDTIEGLSTIVWDQLAR